MNPDTHPSGQLERLIDQALRDQPLLRAPATLEANVLAAVARVPASPWWRRGFLHWPVAARLGFLIASIGFIRIGLLAWERVSNTIGAVETTGIAAVAPGLSWAATVADLLSALNAVSRTLLAGVPRDWLYTGGAVMLSLYALLFGLGAMGYRVFRARR